VQRSAIVGFAGDVDAAHARALATRLADGLPIASALVAPSPVPMPLPRGRRTIIVDKPERVQSQIAIGYPAPAYASPDWLPLSVGAAIFGGTFTSRLMNEVRSKRGWSYGASCRVGRGRAGSATRIRVFPSAEQTADTLALVLGMWEEIAADGVSAAELRNVKSYLEGRWAFEIDTPGKRLDRRIDAMLMGVPPENALRFVERLRAVDLAHVNDAIRRWWRPDDAVITLTATAEEMLPRLAKKKKLDLGEVTTVAFDSY
jgi:zinc protease